MNHGDLHADIDIEAAYDLQHLNNENAIGFDNLVNRAKGETIEEQVDAAQPTIFDKMLADYFLDTRTDYKETNKALTDLVKIFEDERLEKPMKQNGLGRSMTLGEQLIEQSVDKKDYPRVVPDKFRDLMELDIAINQHLTDNKSGLSKQLRGFTDEKKEYMCEIPEYFPIFDVRQPADKYVDNKLVEVVENLFENRAKLEKNMTRRELIAYDKVLSKKLEPKRLREKLVRAIESDYHELN